VRDGSKVPRTAYSPTATTAWGISRIWIAGTPERGKRKEERGKRKEERRKKKEERGKRKEERGKRKEERGKAAALQETRVFCFAKYRRQKRA